MAKSFVFYVHGMTCGSCSSVIKNHLQNIYGEELELFCVDVTELDPKKTTIILRTAPLDQRQEWNKINQHIEEIGYHAEPYEYEKNQAHTPPEPLAANKKSSWFQRILATISSHWFLGALGLITGISLMTVCLVLTSIPLGAMIPLAILSTLLTVLLGAKSYLSAWNKLVYSRSLTMDSLFALSTLTVLIVSFTSFFVPWLPMMFDVGLLIYGFRHIGIGIEETIKKKISAAQFQDRAAKIVRLMRPSETLDTPLYQIQPDDLICINPGQVIPLDGICQEECFIYDTIITGAILPRIIKPGEKVLAGMSVPNDAKPLLLKVTHTAKSSYLARLDAQIAQSIIERAPLEMKTQKILNYFIPTVLLLSLCSGIIIGCFFPLAMAIKCAVSVLVSACPCTLGLIIPLSVKTGVQKAAGLGIQFKNSEALHRAEQVDAVIFDLNGTLTTGVPKVTRCHLLPNAPLTHAQVHDICMTLEQSTTHPIGQAIHAYAKQFNAQVLACTPPDISHHSGVVGCIMGHQYTLGNQTLFDKKGISTEHVAQKLKLEAGDSVLYLAKENTIIAYFIITDPLRPDAQETVNTLRAMGKEIHLCTGADEKTAHRYANALGIKTIYAECLGASIEQNTRSKPAYIESLQKIGRKVAMVGDAANDAKAIAASHFSIAVQSNHSDELTQQHASAMIHNKSMLAVARTFAIAKQAVSNINQNFAISIAYNVISILLAGGLFLAIGISIPPAVGVLFMAVQALSVLLNVYRFKHQPLLPHIEPNPNQSNSPAQAPSLMEIHALPPKKDLAIEKKTTPYDQTSPERKGHITLSLFNEGKRDYATNLPLQDEACLRANGLN